MCYGNATVTLVMPAATARTAGCPPGACWPAARRRACSPPEGKRFPGTHARLGGTRRRGLWVRPDQWLSGARLFPRAPAADGPEVRSATRRRLCRRHRPLACPGEPPASPARPAILAATEPNATSRRLMTASTCPEHVLMATASSCASSDAGAQFPIRTA
jgi:hypothetical protein